MKKNALVGQSGGPTSVINSSLAGVFEACEAHGIPTVYGMEFGVEGLLERKILNLSEILQDSLQIELLKRTPSSFLGSCRYKLPDRAKNTAPYEKIFSLLEEFEIGYFFYIGGNDSMDTIQKLSAYGKEIGSDIRFIGVPKTIDNDLMATDHTPGFGSAAKYIGVVMKEIICDSTVYDLDSVTIVEIMGRNAGWLTAAASLAKGPDCEGVDFICLPEVPFDVSHFMKSVKERLKEKRSLVVAVSEGIHLADGTYVCELANDIGAADAFGHKILTGTARYLANRITRELGVKARAIELSTLQRCASHVSSRTDITEAYQAGGAAVDAALAGHTGEMVIFKRRSDAPYLCTTELFSIDEIANQERKVPLDWILADEMQLTQDFIRYARPLIQAELTAIYVSGLPYHIHR